MTRQRIGRPGPDGVQQRPRGGDAVEAQRGEPRRGEAPLVRVLAGELLEVVVVGRAQELAGVLTRGLPALRRHLLPRALAQLGVGDRVVEQQPTSRANSATFSSAAVAVLSLELLAGAAVRLAWSARSSTSSTKGELLVAEAQPRRVAQPVRPPRQRRDT